MPELIASYGLAVLTEDSIPASFHGEHPLRVSDQWVYHSRLYVAAQFVSQRDDLELIQLNSFGCGLDAVTTDQVAEILERCGKLYTLIKIDEVNSLGAARIRVRSLLAAMAQREKRGIVAHPVPATYHRVEYTRDHAEEGLHHSCAEHVTDSFPSASAGAGEVRVSHRHAGKRYTLRD